MAASCLNANVTAEQLHATLEYSPETGIFLWRYRPQGPTGWNSQFAGMPAGHKTIPEGYIRISLARHAMLGHRVAWIMMTGAWPRDLLDHRDGNRTNNAFNNLRPASRLENNQNRKRQTGTSQYKGVSWLRGKWTAQIQCNKQHYYLGVFATQEAAYEAYCRAALSLHGEFARIS